MAVLACLLLALLASACGGGSTSSAPAATSESTQSGPPVPTGKSGRQSGGGKSTANGDESKPKQGGGSSHSSASASLIREAEAICGQAKKEQVRGASEFAGKPESGPSGKAAVEELTRTVGLPPIKTAVEKLKELKPPAGAAAEFEAVVSGLEKALAEAEADPAVIVTDPHSPFDEPDRLAKEFGLDACAGMA